MVFGALFSSAIVMYTLMSVIAEYASAMGSSTVLAGLVSGIYIFGGLCSRLYSGQALENVGWKRLALVFVCIHAAACFLYFLVDNVWLLILVRFIHGIGFGAATSALMTMGMSVLPRKRFAEGCGYLMLSTTIAVGVGPFFGGMIYDRFGGKGCFTVSCVLAVLMLIFLLFVDVREMDPGVRRREEAKAGGNIAGEEEGWKMPSLPGGRVSKGHWIDRFIELRSVPISVVTGLSALGYASIISFYRLYASQTHLERPFSWFFLIYAFILIFSRPLAGKLQDHFGDKVVCVPGILFQTVGLILVAVHPGIITVIICAVGCAFGFGTLNSACNAIACRHASHQRRSYAVSTFYICCDVGLGFGPMILGLVVSLGGSFPLMYLCAAAFTLLGLPLCLWTLRTR